MDNEQFDKVILLGKLIIAAVPTTIATVTAINKYFEYLNIKVRESSVGETKVVKLEKSIDELCKKFEFLSERVINNSNRMNELHNDNSDLKKGNNDLVQKLVEWMQRK